MGNLLLEISQDQSPKCYARQYRWASARMRAMENEVWLLFSNMLAWCEPWVAILGFSFIVCVSWGYLSFTTNWAKQSYRDTCFLLWSGLSVVATIHQRQGDNTWKAQHKYNNYIYIHGHDHLINRVVGLEIELVVPLADLLAVLLGDSSLDS